MIELQAPTHLHYWRLALQGKCLPIHENHPQEGWYRTRPRKGYRSLPVRIWRDEGSRELLALRDGKRVDPYEVWTWVCLNPVSVEAYEDVLEHGGHWPDEVTSERVLNRRANVLESGTVTGRSVARRHRNTDAVRSPVKPQGLIGHNSQTGLDACHELDVDGDALKIAQDLSLLKSDVLAWLSDVDEITDQVTADLCANYAEAFADLEKKAEGFRTSAKKPILDQGRAIDQRWKPIVSAADEAKRQCKKALEPFLIAETERLEREWLEAVKAENGDLSLLGLSSLTAKAGTFGRTISLRRVRKVRVLDRHALLAHYHRDPRFMNDEAVQKLLAKLAEHDLQAGQNVPGAMCVEEKVAA